MRVFNISQKILLSYIILMKEFNWSLFFFLLDFYEFHMLSQYGCLNYHRNYFVNCEQIISPIFHGINLIID